VLRPRRAAHVSIDSATGAAKRGALFNEEVVAADTEFELYLRLDRADEYDAAEGLKGLLGQVSKRLRLGGKTGSGLGRAELQGLKCHLLDWGDPGQLAEFLAEGGLRPFPWQNAESIEPRAAEPAWEVSGWLIPLEPLLVKSGVAQEEVEGAEWSEFAEDVEKLPGWNAEREPEPAGEPRVSDHEPLREPHATGETRHLVIPGSSLRGPLRNRCRKILNHLLPSDQARELLDGLFGNTDRGGLLFFEDLVPEDEAGFIERLRIQDHVTIDRWTGGAMDKRKYDVCAYFPEPPGFDQAKSPGRLRFRIELEPLPNPKAGEVEAAKGLLFLALRDLADGLVRIGSRKGVGYGKVAVLYDRGPNEQEFRDCVQALHQEIEACATQTSAG
jgi:CRISPR/Cas system CSM-associated protein Csm3 (group 7 of RAMP superfamily)